MSYTLQNVVLSHICSMEIFPVASIGVFQIFGFVAGPGLVRFLRMNSKPK